MASRDHPAIANLRASEIKQHFIAWLESKDDGDLLAHQLAEKLRRSAAPGRDC